MSIQYFLGANTPAGFHSRYDTLFRRLERVWILKGGAGCGKSTLMRKIGQTVRDLGFQTEEILCSSDPDSLDGLVIPSAGLALVDGTAPHVVEPPLCGCGAVYVDMGRFYDGERLLQHREGLFSLKAENAGCYATAYHCLKAAGELSAALEELSDLPGKDDILRCLLPKMPAKQPGQVREVYLTAFTPKGAMALYDTADALCSRLTVLQDNFGSGILCALLQRLVTAGKNVLAGFSPLSPDRPAFVLDEDEGIGWLVSSQLFPYPHGSYCFLDLDSLAEKNSSPEKAARISSLLQLQKALVAQSIDCLAQAKAVHDRLEQLYAPAVDFAGVDALTGRLREQVLQLLGV